MTESPGASADSLFLVWGPPSHGPRSTVFARELGIDIEFVYSTKRRGALVAPWKYTYQALATLWLLLRRRPKRIFVQSPPSFATVVVALYGVVTGARFVIDTHSDAMQLPRWTKPRWLYRWVARRAGATIVTNDVFAGQIRRDGATALIIRDIPTQFPMADPPELATESNILVVNTFADDEPFREIKKAAASLPDVQFHVTGATALASPGDLDDVPPNLHFTGFLPDEQYYSLMRASSAVMCLTTRDNTMQRGACEALSLGRPIVTSDWPLLRDYFRMGTVYVGSASEEIALGIRRVISENAALEQEIEDLAEIQQKEWVDARQHLGTILG